MNAVDCREFTYWQAYDQLYPLGDQATRRILAELVSLYLNVHLGKDAARAKPEDFMPWCEPPAPRQQSVEEMQRIVRRSTQSA